MQADSIQLVWHSKHNVIMLNRQSILYQVFDPEGLFCSLTFWTVSVAATIVTVTHRSAVFAYFFMTAKSSCPAL